MGRVQQGTAVSLGMAACVVLTFRRQLVTAGREHFAGVHTDLAPGIRSEPTLTVAETKDVARDDLRSALQRLTRSELFRLANANDVEMTVLMDSNELVEAIIERAGRARPAIRQQ